jgi:hypothetical protein
METKTCHIYFFVVRYVKAFISVKASKIDLRKISSRYTKYLFWLKCILILFYCLKYLIFSWVVVTQKRYMPNLMLVWHSTRQITPFPSPMLSLSEKHFFFNQLQPCFKHILYNTFNWFWRHSCFKHKGGNRGLKIVMKAGSF